MTYEIIYGDSGKPDPVQVTVQDSNSTILDVMEQAVIAYGNDYTFTVSYTTSEWGHGYFVDKLNGAASKEVRPKYYWFLYLDDIKSSKGVSDATVDGVSTVSWRYERSLL